MKIKNKLVKQKKVNEMTISKVNRNEKKKCKEHGYRKMQTIESQICRKKEKEPARKQKNVKEHTH